MKTYLSLLITCFAFTLDAQSGYVYYRDSKPPPQPSPPVIYQNTGIKCGGTASKQIGYERKGTNMKFTRCDRLVAGPSGKCECARASTRLLYNCQLDGSLGEIRHWGLFQWNPAKYADLQTLEKDGFDGIDKSFSSSSNTGLSVAALILDEKAAYLSYGSTQRLLDQKIRDILRFPPGVLKTPEGKRLFRSFLEEILALLAGSVHNSFTARPIALDTQKNNRGILFQTGANSCFLIWIKGRSVFRKRITLEAEEIQFEEATLGNGRDVIRFYWNEN